jgi:hypothetical protein
MPAAGMPYHACQLHGKHNNTWVKPMHRVGNTSRVNSVTNIGLTAYTAKVLDVFCSSMATSASRLWCLCCADRSGMHLASSTCREHKRECPFVRH